MSQSAGGAALDSAFTWRVILNAALDSLLSFLAGTVKPFDLTAPIHAAMLRLLHQEALAELVRLRNEEGLCGRVGCASAPRHGGLEAEKKIKPPPAARTTTDENKRLNYTREQEKAREQRYPEHEAINNNNNNNNSSKPISRSATNHPTSHISNNNSYIKSSNENNNSENEKDYDPINDSSSTESDDESETETDAELEDEAKENNNDNQGFGGDLVDEDELRLEESFRLARRLRRELDRRQRREQHRFLKSKPKWEKVNLKFERKNLNNSRKHAEDTDVRRFCSLECWDWHQVVLRPRVQKGFGGEKEDLPAIREALGVLFPNLRPEVLQKLCEAPSKASVRSSQPTPNATSKVKIPPNNQSTFSNFNFKLEITERNDDNAAAEAVAAIESFNPGRLWGGAPVERLHVVEFAAEREAFVATTSEDKKNDLDAWDKKKSLNSKNEDFNWGHETATSQPVLHALQPSMLLRGTWLVLDFVLTISTRRLRTRLLRCYAQRCRRTQTSANNVNALSNANAQTLLGRILQFMWRTLDAELEGLSSGGAIPPLVVASTQNNNNANDKSGSTCSGTSNEGLKYIIGVETIKNENESSERYEAKDPRAEKDPVKNDNNPRRPYQEEEEQDDLYVDPRRQCARRELFFAHFFSAAPAAVLSRLLGVDEGLLLELVWTRFWNANSIQLDENKNLNHINRAKNEDRMEQNNSNNYQNNLSNKETVNGSSIEASHKKHHNIKNNNNIPSNTNPNSKNAKPTYEGPLRDNLALPFRIPAVFARPPGATPEGVSLSLVLFLAALLVGPTELHQQLFKRGNSERADEPAEDEIVEAFEEVCVSLALEESDLTATLRALFVDEGS